MNSSPPQEESRRARLARLLQRKAEEQERWLPLSRGQAALWFIQQQVPDTPAYHIAFTCRFRQPVDAAALERTLQQLVRRHPSLRTTFPVVDGVPGARVRGSASFTFAVVDVESSETDEKLAGRVQADYERPFDLASGPLLRATLYRRGESDQVLLLALHHIICDAWSIWLLLAELHTIYPAELSGRAHTLSLPERDFGDFVREQEAWLSGEGGELAWRYWQQQLAAPLPALEIPPDRPRPASQRYRGAVCHAQIDGKILGRLRETGRQEGVTLFHLLLTAWGLLLRRLSGQEEVVVGTPTTGRSAAHFSGLVGYCVNPVALRLQHEGSLTLREQLHRNRSLVVEALRHQQLPLPTIIERLALERDPSTTPLFQTLFVLQKPQVGESGLQLPSADGEQVELAGLMAEAWPIAQMVGQFDLILEVLESDQQLRVTIKYNSDLFSGETGRRVSGLLVQYVSRLSAGLDLAIDDVGASLPAWNGQIEAWNRSGYDLGPVTTLDRLIADQASQTPQIEAVRYEGESIDYRTLDRRANHLAQRLREAGAGPDRLVGVCMERSIELMVALLAILKAGSGYLPIDPDYPPERQRWMAEDSGLTLLLMQPDLVGSLPFERGRTMVVAAEDRHEAALPPPPVDAGDTASDRHLAYVIYTSGSTGKPKGVMVEHRAIVNRLRWMQRHFSLTPAERVVQKTPLSFDVSLWELFWPLICGATLVMAKPGGHRDSRYLVELIRSEQITTIHFVPSMLAIVVDEPTLSSCDSLRRVICSGEALSPALARRTMELLPQSGLWNLYGPTEAAVDVSWWQCHADDPYATVPIGWPIDNIWLEILDQQLRRLPPGVAGELYIGGIGLARGYLGRDELTAGRFVTDPYRSGERLYRTGDRARYLEGGAIEYLGRLDQQVKLRGLRIEPGEIESLLVAQPGVARAAVVVDERLARLVAAVVADAGATPDPAVIGMALGRQLPAFMCPDPVVVLDALPLSPSGKLDRSALLTTIERIERQADRPATAATRGGGQTESEIAAIWCELLERPAVAVDDSFFRVGGHSLLLARLRHRLEQQYGVELEMVDLFRAPTVAAQARLVRGEASNPPGEAGALPPVSGDDSPAIAIIGMAGRFPGADSVGELLAMLRSGGEGIRHFDRDELLAAGVDPQLLDHPDYVAANGLLDGFDRFDHQFFGYSPQEAAILDPQQRLLLECCWNALEDAAIRPGREGGRIGLFAGAGFNTYLIKHLAVDDGLRQRLGDFQLMIANDKDHVATRAAWQLDLTGPAVSVNTACSTSLVAVHLAIRSLRSGECEVAVAGGVSLRPPQVEGYLWQEGMILSRDGHCRPFAAAASGTVGGNGVGLVVLKPLAAALRDGDPVDAVILGSAVNNDGADKVGYTAPSVGGQSAVIRAALADAAIAARSVGYIEAHGTATPLGDPVELAALRDAYGSGDGWQCRIGSIKSNIGHLDTAAGVSGLIKAALMVRNGEWLPTIHFDRPNPALALEEGPFTVVDRHSPWQRGEWPRRAGVSSFGIGGTNAHLIVEEPPATSPAREGGKTDQSLPLLLSARSREAVQERAAALCRHWQQQPELALVDLAATLAEGRAAMEWRAAPTAASRDQALAKLSTLATGGSGIERCSQHGRGVVFLFPGQGSQWPGMGRALYERPGLFRSTIEQGVALLSPLFDLKPLSILYPEPAEEEAARETMRQTRYTQPLLYLVEVALARHLQSLGVEPLAVAGHSLGEWVAATVAGVVTFEEGLLLVARRSAMMQSMAPGAMVAVEADEERLAPLIEPGVTIALYNGPGRLVLAGSQQAIERQELKLAASGIDARRLVTSHAFHSPAMEPMLDGWRAELERVELKPPTLPLLSNSSGDWAGERVTSVDYWVEQLRQPVRFDRNLAALFAEPQRLLLEVGPGETLTTLARRHEQRVAGQPLIATLAGPSAATPADESIANALSRLWMAGVEWRWSPLVAAGRRVHLPGYPFAATRHWVEPEPPAARATEAVSEIADTPLLWGFRWVSSPLPFVAGKPPADWSLFSCDPEGSSALVDAGRGESVVITPLAAVDEERAVGTDYWTDWLAGAVGNQRLIVDCRPLAEPILLLHSLGRAVAGWRDSSTATIELLLLTAGGVALGGEPLAGGQAAVAAATLLLPRELEGVRLRQLDLATGSLSAVATDVVRLLNDNLDHLAAGRVNLLAHNACWLEEPFGMEEVVEEGRLPEGGVYLIVGGFGGIGSTLAGVLARCGAPHLLLAGRGGGDRSSVTERLEEAGATVTFIECDLSEPDAIEQLIRRVRSKTPRLDGLIHAAGMPGQGLASQLESEQLLRSLRLRSGIESLVEALEPRFVLLSSSLAAIDPEIGQFDYCAANRLLEASASRLRQRGFPVVAVEWDTWQGVGMAARAEVLPQLAERHQANLRAGIEPRQAERVLEQLIALTVAGGPARIAVSRRNLPLHLARPRLTLAEEWQLLDRDGDRREERSLSQQVAGVDCTTTEWLIGAWSELLGAGGIDGESDFFALGGHSLLASRLIGRIRERYGVEMGVATLFDHPTPRELAEWIDQQSLASADPELLAALLGEIEGDG